MNETKKLIPKSGLSGQADLLGEILHSMPQILVLLDKNRCVVHMFNVQERMMGGYEIEDMLGKPIIDSYAKRPDTPFFEACRQLSAALDHVQEKGSAVNVEYKLLGADLKATVSKLSDGKILIQIHDVTELVRKQTESERSRRNELSMTLKAGQLTSWTYDIQEQMLRSPHRNNIIGECISYDKLKERIHPDYRLKSEQFLESIISGGLEHNEITIRMVNMDGELVWINVHALPHLYTADGKVAVLLGSQKDVTKKMKYEQQRTTLMRQNKLIMDNANAGFVFITPDYLVAWENTTRVLPPEFEDGTYFFESGELCYKNEYRLKNSHTRELVEATFSDKTVHRIEKQLPHSIWIDMTATPVIETNQTVEGVVLKIEDISQRKQAEIEIAEQKQQLREVVRQNELIMNNSSAGFVYLTPDYKVVWENVSTLFPEYLSLNLYPVGNYCYKAFGRTVPCESCVMYRAMESGKMCHSEYQMQDGRTAEIFGNPVFNNNKEIKGVILHISDITERKEYIRRIEESEQEIATKNQLLSAILEYLPYPLFIKDASDNYNYVLTNKAYNRLLAISEEWIIGKNDYDVFPTGEADVFRAADTQVINERRLCIVEEETYTYDGSKRIWHITKAPLIDEKSGRKMLIGVALDITELIQERHEVEYANRLLDFTFIAGGSIPWEWDLQSGKMSSANKFSVFYQQDLTLAEYIARFVHPDHREMFTQQTDDLREKRSGKLDSKLLTLYNDSYEWTRIVGQEINDPRTLQPKAVGVSWFITKEVEQQQELIEARKQAERSDALKSAFLANMSHEIRTPLNAIVGFSGLLQETSDKEERETYLNIINTNNELLLKLVGDILDLSKIEAGYIDHVNSRFDLEELLGDIVVMFQNKVKPEVQLVHHKSYDHCFVKLDRLRVTQLVTNFLTNAFKFTTQGSIEIGYDLTRSGVRLYVKDTGCGISKENIGKVFDRFVKLDSFTQGTGLGMAICKAIAESYGGEIGVKSELDHGTMFWVSLPTPTDTKDETKARTPVNKSSVNHPTGIQDRSFVKILLVEDNESNYLLMKGILKGYDLTRVYNGTEAVDKIKSDTIDIVLMDIHMSAMDGLHSTKKIREFNDTVPIVTITSNALEEDRLEASQAGCSYFLSKPINKRTLLKVIEDITAVGYFQD